MRKGLPAWSHHLYRKGGIDEIRQTIKEEAVTDCGLDADTCLYCLSLYRIELHWAGGHAIHAIWENWAMAHVIASVLFLMLGIWHVCLHQNWYKSLLSKGLGNKSIITVFLSVSMLVLLTTGILLLAVIEGPNSHIGLIHFWFGLLLIIFSCIHILKRWEILFQNL